MTPTHKKHLAGLLKGAVGCLQDAIRELGADVTDEVVMGEYVDEAQGYVSEFYHVWEEVEDEQS